MPPPGNASPRLVLFGSNPYATAMPSVKNSVPVEDEIDTVIDANIVFTGALETGKNLLVKGRISGTIVCAGDLFLAPESVIDADIRAPRVVVRGRLSGTVRAAESIQVLAGAEVSASLEAPDITIEEKEKFTGRATVTGADTGTTEIQLQDE